MKLDGLRRLLFVLVATVPALFISERLYWYFGRSVAVQLEIWAFYAPALAAVLWLVSRYRAHDLWSLLLVVPVFAYLVEGAIVPVLYSGGPMVPFFPAMFTFWHGTLGIVLVLVMFRRWLLDGRWKPLLVSSTALGAYWGMWALTAIVPDEVPEFAGPEPDPIEILSTSGFALYAAACTAALMAAHYLLNFVWMSTFTPSKRTRWVWMAIVAFGVIAWTFAIPWAAPMFAAYVGVQVWALRRMPRHDGPTLLEQLDGRFPITNLWPLLAIPATASVSYVFWSGLELSLDVVENYIFILLSALQGLIGLGILIASHVKAIRRKKAASFVQPTPPQRPVGMVSLR